jgi:P-type E1-E2 ATPase
MDPAVALIIEIPGRAPIEIGHLLLDVNGTLSDRGRLLAGVAESLAALRGEVEILLLSADTFGTLADLSRELGAPARTASAGEDKVALLRELGPQRCAAIGNGANDAGMLREAALGIAVVGPEGANGATLAAADVVCRSITDALGLLREPRALAATLRP